MRHGYDCLFVDLDGVVYRGRRAVPHAVDALNAFLRTGAVRHQQRESHAGNSRGATERIRITGGRRGCGDLCAGSGCTSGDVGACRRRDSRHRLGRPDPGRARQNGLRCGHLGRRGGCGGSGVLARVGLEGPGGGVLRPGAGDPVGGVEHRHVGADGARDRPGDGTFVAAVAAATGRQPVVTGKPHEPIMELARSRAHASRPLVIGDRLDTDVAAANAAGMDSLLVLTGVSTWQDLVTCLSRNYPRGWRRICGSWPVTRHRDPGPGRVAARVAGGCGCVRRPQRGYINLRRRSRSRRLASRCSRPVAQRARTPVADRSGR